MSLIRHVKAIFSYCLVSTWVNYNALEKQKGVIDQKKDQHKSTGLKSGTIICFCVMETPALGMAVDRAASRRCTMVVSKFGCGLMLDVLFALNQRRALQQPQSYYFQSGVGVHIVP